MLSLRVSWVSRPNYMLILSLRGPRRKYGWTRIKDLRHNLYVASVAGTANQEQATTATADAAKEMGTETYPITNHDHCLIDGGLLYYNYLNSLPKMFIMLKNEELLVMSHDQHQRNIMIHIVKQEHIMEYLSIPLSLQAQEIQSKLNLKGKAEIKLA